MGSTCSAEQCLVKSIFDKTRLGQPITVGASASRVCSRLTASRLGFRDQRGEILAVVIGALENTNNDLSMCWKIGDMFSSYVAKLARDAMAFY